MDADVVVEQLVGWEDEYDNELEVSGSDLFKDPAERLHIRKL
jgi:hypothetical protein